MISKKPQLWIKRKQPIEVTKTPEMKKPSQSASYIRKASWYLNKPLMTAIIKATREATPKVIEYSNMCFFIVNYLFLAASNCLISSWYFSNSSLLHKMK